MNFAIFLTAAIFLSSADKTRPQKTYLVTYFEGTPVCCKNNPHRNHKGMSHRARLAHIASDIMAMPTGYQALTGEEISGGQRRYTKNRDFCYRTKRPAILMLRVKT